MAREVPHAADVMIKEGTRGREELRTVLAVGLTKFAVLFECFHYSDCTIRLLYYMSGLLATVCRMVAATKRERVCR